MDVLTRKRSNAIDALEDSCRAAVGLFLVNEFIGFERSVKYSKIVSTTLEASPARFDKLVYLMTSNYCAEEVQKLARQGVRWCCARLNHDSLLVKSIDTVVDKEQHICEMSIQERTTAQNLSPAAAQQQPSSRERGCNRNRMHTIHGTITPACRRPASPYTGICTYIKS